MQILNFLKYNNAVPIAISLVLLGAGGTFAATNPGAIYSATPSVISIDNTYLVGKDLPSYSPKTLIVSVTEDSEYYYVAYSVFTIDIKDSVWQDVTRGETMRVSKADLGPYRDLGEYVTVQLNQIVDHEHQRLTEAQADAKQHVSQKTVATAYGGLIGKFLDTSTETLPGYTPVVVLPVTHESDAQTAAAAQASGGSSPQAAAPSSPSSHGSSSAPAIQILGNNPAVIPTGTSYSDLGAVVSDDRDHNLGLHVLLDGKEVQSVQLDISTTTEYRVVYRATDNDGNTTEVFRRVIVYDAKGPAPVVDPIPAMQPFTPVEQTPPSPASPPPPAPAPAPTREPTSPPPTPPVVVPPPATTTSPAATSTPPSDSSASTTPPSFATTTPADTSAATSTSPTASTSSTPTDTSTTTPQQ